ncbi:MAG TPA: hypothetical protein VEP93_03255 [Variovorax sp.]|nr:hypothetical protein [Variovorax sp.]
MNSVEERHAFSERLRAALDDAGWKSIGATALAREFNLRNDGPPVTAHATRKWMQGEAVPVQDNLQALARWLQVPAHWLRFGEGPSPLRAGEPSAPQYGVDRAAKLAGDIARLGAEQQVVVEELIGVLLKRKKSSHGQ